MQVPLHVPDVRVLSTHRREPGHWAHLRRESPPAVALPLLCGQPHHHHDFQDRQTRGCVEGFNNRVKVLKRRGYGIFDVGRRFQRLTLDLHGYHLFGHT